MRYIAFAFLSLAGFCQAQNWTDRGEYDLVLALREEASPEKKLALLDQWKAKYPKSQLGGARRELMMATLQSIGAWPRMLDASQEILSESPKDSTALYWTVVLTPGAKDPKPAAIAEGAKAAQRLIEDQSSIPPEQRESVELLARRMLAWAHWQKPDYAAAEKELEAILKKDPENTEASAWMGLVMLAQKQADKQSPALWHLARASSLDGSRAQSESRRTALRELLEKSYASYHGSPEGLPAVVTSAKAQPLPPLEFRIESSAELEARRQQEELERTNPELAAWLKIRKTLQAADGAQQFEAMKGTPLQKLKGTLIRFSPANRPKELVLGLADAGVEEVILQLDQAFTTKPVPGAVLEFEATPLSFAPEPFTVTMSAAREKIVGWTAAPR